MKSLLFAFAAILLFSFQSHAQVYVGDDSSAGPPPVYYRDGRPYVPGYNGNYPNAPRGQANTVEVGRPYYYPNYYGYPGYGYGYGYGPTAYPDENTVVVGQPYYGYGPGFYGY